MPPHERPVDPEELIAHVRLEGSQGFDAGRQAHADGIDHELVAEVVLGVGQHGLEVGEGVAQESRRVAGSQRDRLGQGAVAELRTQDAVGYQVDLRIEQVAELLLERAELHQAEWGPHGEQQIDVGVVVVLTCRHRPEHPDVAAAGVGDDPPDLTGVLAEASGQRRGAVEVQQPGHLGLAASDLGRDLGLAHAARRGLPDGADEFGPRLSDRIIGAVRNLGETRRHATSIASAMAAAESIEIDDRGALGVHKQSQLLEWFAVQREPFDLNIAARCGDR